MKRDINGWLAYIEQQHPKSIEMGLDRVREVASRMRLEKPAKHVITVGGTNGKGSTVAFIDAIAREAGWHVGTYTSPHLLRYNERVRIDGREANDEELVEAFEAVEAARLSLLPPGEEPAPYLMRGGAKRRMREGELQPTQTTLSPEDELRKDKENAVQLTYFEFGTLAALWLFQRAELDLAVLEVGLGGRLDAVNLVDPDVSVITTVDIDHTDWLGEDREKIGYEKVGIARPWKPLVLGEIDSPSSVLRHAYAIGANAIRLGSDFFHEPIDQDHWCWREVGAELTLPNPVLVAPVQRANAASAIAALRALDAVDAVIPESAFAAGVAAASLPGRLQRFQHGGVEVVVDVGHNPQAARELNVWLQEQPNEGGTRAVFAALSDKDVTGVVAALEESIQCWYLAGLEGAGVGARGQDVAALAARLSDTAAAGGERHANVRQALKAAMDSSRPGDRVLVFGSFHTAAEALVSLHSVL